MIPFLNYFKVCEKVCEERSAYEKCLNCSQAKKCYQEVMVKSPSKPITDTNCKADVQEEN